jgi:hypothetical protein
MLTYFLSQISFAVCHVFFMHVEIGYMKSVLGCTVIRRKECLTVLDSYLGSLGLQELYWGKVHVIGDLIRGLLKWKLRLGEGFESIASTIEVSLSGFLVEDRE